MSDSDFLENKILDYVLGRTRWDATSATEVPATLYLALFTVTPTDAGGGTEVTTGAWTNYARLAITNNSTNFPNASGGSKSNGVELDHGIAAIPGAAPSLVAAGLMDASSLGNLVKWCLLTGQPITIQNNDPVVWPIGSLDFTQD